MDKTIGIIGGGNMGEGILSGIVRAALVAPCDIIVADVNPETRTRLANAYGVRVTADNCEAAQMDIVCLVVKPFLLAEVIEQVKDCVREDALVISVAAGRTIETVETAFGRQLAVIRIMPTLAALVGESVTAYVPNALVSDEQLAAAVMLFQSFGGCVRIKESQMDCFIGIGGSAPAYLCQILEAMADAAVLGGLPRKEAYEIATRAMLGTAKYIKETGCTPSRLKDMVCTPGGTSIEGVVAFEEEGGRAAVIAAACACAEKSARLS